MFRKLSETFSATHATILALGAMFVPGALYAIPSFSNVAIEDPNSGSRAYVDGGRRLAVYDPIAGFANNPSNLYRIYGTCTGGTSGATLFTPPAGKAFVVKSVNFSFYDGTSGSDNYVYLADGSEVVSGVDSVNAADAHSQDLGTGYFVQHTETLSTTCASAGTYLVSVVGYLTPQGIVPGAEASVRAGPHVSKAGHSF